MSRNIEIIGLGALLWWGCRDRVNAPDAGRPDVPDVGNVVTCEISRAEEEAYEHGLHRDWVRPATRGDAGEQVYLVSLLPGLPMYRCGLRTGDVILEVNSTSVGAIEAANVRPDSPLRLKVERNGRILDFHITNQRPRD